MSLFPLGIGGGGDGGTSDQQLIPFLTEILDHLKADYVKADTRFIKYLEGTQTIILDKDVSFNPDTGYTVTSHQLIPSSGLATIQSLSSQQLKTVLTNIFNQLTADYFKGDTRFIKYLQDTQTVILDKDVSFDPEAGYTITEHQ